MSVIMQLNNKGTCVLTWWIDISVGQLDVPFQTELSCSIYSKCL